MTRPFVAAVSTATLIATLAISGCSATPASTGQAQDTSARPTAQPSTVADRPRPVPDPQLQALLNRLDALEQDNQLLKSQVRQQEIAEIEARRAQQAALEQARRMAQAPPAAQPGPVTPGPVKPAVDSSAMSRRDLHDALLSDVISGSDSPRVKALMAAALSLASPRHELDHRLLNDLDPRNREQVARFHQMIAVAYDELAADSNAQLDRQAMIDKLDEVFGQQPLQIETIEICRRVDGYGVYEAFEGHRFPAGQLNRTLVYIEINNFVHQPVADGGYEVKVSIELEIYDNRGEVIVWRQQPEMITDVSRNRRRDFFLIQPMNLPASLGAGAYRMKVRVKDLNSGSLAESTISDLQLVADQAMVQQRR